MRGLNFRTSRRRAAAPVLTGVAMTVAVPTGGGATGRPGRGGGHGDAYYKDAYRDRSKSWYSASPSGVANGRKLL